MKKWRNATSIQTSQQLKEAFGPLESTGGPFPVEQLSDRMSQFVAADSSAVGDNLLNQRHLLRRNLSAAKPVGISPGCMPLSFRYHHIAQQWCHVQRKMIQTEKFSIGSFKTSRSPVQKADICFFVIAISANADSTSVEKQRNIRLLLLFIVVLKEPHPFFNATTG